MASGRLWAGEARLAPRGTREKQTTLVGTVPESKPGAGNKRHPSRRQMNMDCRGVSPSTRVRHRSTQGPTRARPLVASVAASRFHAPPPPPVQRTRCAYPHADKPPRNADTRSGPGGPGGARIPPALDHARLPRSGRAVRAERGRGGAGARADKSKRQRSAAPRGAARDKQTGGE